MNPRSYPLAYAARDANPPAGVLAGHAAALARLRATGLPSPKVEDWKYTNLRALAERELRPADPAAEFAAEPGGDVAPVASDEIRVTFVNGALRSVSDTEELPPGVAVTSLAKAIQDRPELLAGAFSEASDGDDDDAPLALLDVNTAFAGDGLVLAIEDGVVLKRPIHLVSLGAAGESERCAFHTRGLVRLGAGARAEIVETHAGVGDYWSNPVIEIALGAGARLTHAKLQQDDGAATHLALTRVALDAGAEYSNFALATGAALSRNEIEVTLAGEGAVLNLDGIYLMRGRQHADTTTRVLHRAEGCTSREVYKGVLDERARGVFQGRIVVAKGAQRTDARMMNRTILLADAAEIDTKPELEIFANDVACAHGATVGTIDEDALFYLRSRGVPEDAAREMLIRAFLAELSDTVAAPGARGAVGAAIGAWLGDGTTAPEEVAG